MTYVIDCLIIESKNKEASIFDQISPTHMFPFILCSNYLQVLACMIQAEKLIFF